MAGFDMKTNSMDGQYKRINKILANVDRKDIMALLNAWNRYLENLLVFPFEAKVLGDIHKGPLKYGDTVSVKKMSVIDDLYGIIIELRCGRKKFYHPLSDLEVIDNKSSHYLHVNDYSVWMANR
jgi:hypothetical protein